VNRQIHKEEEEKTRVQNELRHLSERLNRLNESLSRKVQARQEYEKTLQETEAAYGKVSLKVFLFIVLFLCLIIIF
jgi:Sjoegren syndrome nuclear autoantigen 1